MKWFGAAAWVGEMPENCPGDCQFEIVDGDWVGEFSSLSDCVAELWGIDDAPCGAMASIPSGIFLRCPRCFSSICKRPSLVNGLGRTSFIPRPIRKGASHSPENEGLTMMEIHRDVVTPNV